MKNDLIVDEVRKNGLALAARYGNNIEAICKALKEREQTSGRRVVNRLPHRLEPKAKLLALHDLRNDMLQPGEIINVDVEAVEVFGIFCRYGSQIITVLIPETSWIASFCSCQQFAQPGDTLKVKVIHVDHERGRINGSIRGLYENPWESAQFQLGQEYSAQVYKFVPKADHCNDQPGYLVEVVPGAYAMMCAIEKELQPGEPCKVTIKKIIQEKRAVEVVLSAKSS